MDERRSDPLAQDNTQGITHAQQGRGHGPLSVREPVLGYLGGNPGYEGTGHPSDSLSYHGKVILIHLRNVLAEARQRAQTAQESSQTSEVGSYLDTSLQTSRLYQVSGYQTGGDSCGIAHCRYQVQLVTSYLVISGGLNIFSFEKNSLKTFVTFLATAGNAIQWA